MDAGEAKMIDIHAHILPGIDDGAQDLYDTLEMAQMAADCGVTAIVATPHCNIPGIYKNYFGDAYLEAFYSARSAIEKEGIPLKLYPGMEVFVTYDLPELIADGKIMTMNQGHYLLMEFSFDEDPKFASEMLKKVREMDIIPVVAHVERYEFIQEDPYLIYQWKKAGYAIQANKGSFQGRFGRKAWKTAYELLDHNLLSVVASDAHSPYRRTTHLRDAYEILAEDFSRNYLDLLFQKNPEQICRDGALDQSLPILLPE